MAVPFDPQRLTATGAAVPVEGVLPIYIYILLYEEAYFCAITCPDCAINCMGMDGGAAKSFVSNKATWQVYCLGRAVNQSNTRSGLVDGMRGISILLVLILHFHAAYGLDQGFFATHLSATFVRALARNGGYGVTIFFVISGFLITSTSLSRFGQLRNVSLRAFYTFRFARIAPNLALILAVAVPLVIAGVPFFASKPGNPSIWVTVFSILTFTHNLLMQKFGFFNWGLNILWSLSVEEMFYFTFPLVCILLRKDVRIIALWALVVIVAPIYRSHYKENPFIPLNGYLSCFDAIAIGCIAALLRQRLRLPNTSRRLTLYLATAVIVCVYLYKGIMANVVYGPTLIALAAGVILLGSQSGISLARSSGNMVVKAVGWFGKISYELYLFHMVVLALMKIALKSYAFGYYTKPLCFALFITLSAFVAGTISRFYSEPLNRMIRRTLSSTYSRPQRTFLSFPSSPPSSSGHPTLA
jgi:peptidoglycan/LPS O-acetylase OafA/YrhL